MLATLLTLPGMARKSLVESDKKVNIGVRVTPVVLRALQDAAAAQDRTVSYIASKALERCFAKAANVAEPPKPREKRGK